MSVLSHVQSFQHAFVVGSGSATPRAKDLLYFSAEQAVSSSGLQGTRIMIYGTAYQGMDPTRGQPGHGVAV